MTDEPIKKKDLTDFMSEVSDKITNIEKLTSASPTIDTTPSEGAGAPPAPVPDEVAKLKKELAASRKQLADSEKAQKTKILDSFDKERKEKYKDSSLEVLEAVRDEQSESKTPFIGNESRSQGEISEKKKHAYLDRMNQKTIYS